MRTHGHLLLLARVEIEESKLQQSSVILNRDQELPSRPKRDLIANHDTLSLDGMKSSKTQCFLDSEELSLILVTGWQMQSKCHRAV
jgi:hypothetical protein